MRKAALLVITLLFSATVVAQAADYEPFYLGALAGGESRAYGLNARGEVVGSSTDAGGRDRAFLWTREGGMLDLGTLGGANSVALAINDAGEIVGYSDTAQASRHGFLRTVQKEMHDLGVLPRDSTSEATAISDIAVGWSRAEGGRVHAFTWSVDNGMTGMADLEPGGDTRAFGVNSQGVVVGMAKDADGNLRAVSWRPDGTLSIREAGSFGGNSSAAYGINEGGLIVGEATDASGQTLAFCWIPNSGLHQLPTPPGMRGARATAINDSNQIVGYALGKVKQPVLWEIIPSEQAPVTIRCTVLPLLRGTVEGEAAAVNNSGVIAGTCVTKDGKSKAVVWRPAKKKTGPSIALVGGVFVPSNSQTRDDFASTWLRIGLKPFEREKRTWPHFSAEGGALQFSGPTDVELYQITAGVEKGFSPRGSVQPYVSLRVGPYYGRMTEDLTGAKYTKVGLNANASVGLIFSRSFYAEARYDYFNKFEGVNFSGFSLAAGFRLFDLPR